MSQQPLPDANAPHGQTLVVQVRDAIRAQITNGDYRTGDRLPSEAKLTQDFGVSRTVVREAIAALRSDGLVEPRQGAGVFVLDAPHAAALPFRDVDLARVSSLIEMLELRTAVEGDAAGLAALRHSPAQEERIIEALEELRSRSHQGKPTSDADFAFHMAVADASNNPRFAEFLNLIGPTIIPRRAVSPGTEPNMSAEYLQLLDAEHEDIVTAIQSHDEEAARAAMRRHLKNSQSRYRQYLRNARRMEDGGAN